MRPLLLLLALASCLAVLEARRRTPPPLKGEHERHHRRRPRKSSVCHFDKKTYELEAMWNPDLGAPFGVMFCVQCECVPIQRKRRVVGRVRCRNIKRSCPKPRCKYPVLPVGECCKTCNDDANRRSRPDHADEDDEPNGKEFAVLMTGLSSSPPNQTSAVATGRFRLARRVLTYSIYYDRMPRPGRIVFFDDDANIVEELPTFSSDYEVLSQKVCGVWNKMPRRYRRKLKSGQLHVGLALGAPSEDNLELMDLVISGKILRYRGLQTEKFSALLAPSEPTAPPSGAGGTAIVSLASQTGGFHLTLVARGLWGPDDPGDGRVVVQMSARNSNNSKMTLDGVRVAKIKDGEAIVDTTTSLLRGEMRQLARADLLIKVFSRLHPERQLSGIIMPRIGCNIFSALLSGVKSSDSPPPRTTASGLATLRLWNDGRLDYAIRLLDVRSTVLGISIETSSRGRGRDSRPPYEVVDVLPQYLNGWANGTLRRMVAKDVEALLDEDLFINVATERYRSELRGRVTRLTFSGTLQSDAPIMLTSRNSSSAGVAWMAVDDDCTLHYKVQVADRNRGNRRIELVEFPGRVPRKRMLAEFGGSRAENRIHNLPKTTMMRMGRGLTLVKVVPLNGDDEISSEHAKVSVPKSCLPARLIHMRGYFSTEAVEENEIEQAFDCEYEEHVYEDGAQWDALHDSCKICSCNHGKVVCETIVCPTLACDNQLKPPESCCPTCSNDTLAGETNVANQGCSLAGRFRRVGSTWHPFVPPFGFDKCVICTCQASSQPGEYRVSCSKPSCPPLDCPGREYQASSSCCRQCRSPEAAASRDANVTHGEGGMHDQAREMTQKEIQQAGGCRKDDAGLKFYRNGQQWNPRVVTIGVMPCVICQCRDGHISCSRTKCPSLTCGLTKRHPGTCCPVCADGRHHQKTRRRRQHRAGQA